jgi:hypothetical protein
MHHYRMALGWREAMQEAAGQTRRGIIVFRKGQIIPHRHRIVGDGGAKIAAWSILAGLGEAPRGPR